MLYHKHGTLAEDRFKNLTQVQWLFHYLEIQKYQEQEIKFQSSLLEELLAYVKLTWKVIDPEKSSLLLDTLKQYTMKQDKPEAPIDEITPENFKEKWESMMKVMPASIAPPPEIIAMRQASRIVMPTASRKDFIEGISIEKPAGR